MLAAAAQPVSSHEVGNSLTASWNGLVPSLVLYRTSMITSAGADPG
jgi:hypothetical protein